MSQQRSSSASFGANSMLGRTLTVYGAGFALTLAVLVSVAVVFFAPRFRELQEKEITHREEVVRQAFQSEADRLSELARTNAVWDDAYAYAMKGRPAHFTATNYSLEARRQIELAGVAIIDRSERVIFRTDLGEAQVDPILQHAIDASRTSPELALSASRTVRSSVVSTDHRAALVSSAAIVRSDGSGPPAGRMVFVRNVDEALIQHLARQAQTAVRLDLDGETWQGEHVLRRVPLVDAFGNTTGSFVLLGTKDVLSLGEDSLMGLGLATVVILLVVAAGTGRVLTRTIVAPVRQLADEVQRGALEPDVDDPRARPPAELLQLRAAFRDAFARVHEETERHRAAAATAEEARAAAEQANQAKSQFLAVMSHELRTPLNAVIGYSEILQEDLSTDGQAASAADAERIRRAARHLLSLINDVLDLSKIEAGRMELHFAPLDIATLVRDVVDQVRPLAEARGNTVTATLPDDLVPKMADIGKLRQCLLNLMSNANKFTQGGQIDLTVTRTDGGLRFAVRDTGIGMQQHDVDRLFQPFMQVDSSHTRRQDGTGLGLAITQRLARLMGGDVTVSSQLGVGSTFVLTIAASRAITPSHLAA